ncbi:hypothetical protein [Tenacibaculum soleae]|uniref:hypothetical protein n=1 Tax=Tenacibaculum soleae TaxID=447689 RepID=UPI0026E1303C|nr:hypothetical protein [Tenacibaculum soleae]MDO6813805.1 hypothetical protein [Tenacibaculum soleae]
MEVKTDFSKKVKELVEKCFTSEFLKNEINLQDKFNELKVNVDRVDIYDSGEIMSIAVDLTAENKDILKSIVKDFDLYNELVDLEFHSGKKEDQTDLCSIIDYSSNKLNTTILYNWDDKIFHFEGE